ncbi:hypothetical protein GGH91_006133 [Coemansia sp. RSA 2671]|uniref:Uncharacterized protein n=1 Tax=Coemansia linderi TaxID=2663919 RepID=A0ACC1KL36_9FUNG|nr:hypothetical protein GGH91_006133 [Coemansia sp. RSA 2671]KAJ2791331.1 hypothetical protein GGI18_001215 [Coemansia linderi]
MPTCEILCNALGAGVDAGALSAKAAAVVAQLLSKPLGYMMAYVTVNPSLTVGGTDAPAAYVSIASIGAVGGPKNGAIVAEMTGFISRELGIQPERIFVGIRDMPASDFGHNGKTFA